MIFGLNLSMGRGCSSLELSSSMEDSEASNRGEKSAKLVCKWKKGELNTQDMCTTVCPGLFCLSLLKEFHGTPVFSFPSVCWAFARDYQGPRPHVPKELRDPHDKYTNCGTLMTNTQTAGPSRRIHKQWDLHETYTNILFLYIIMAEHRTGLSSFTC